MFHEEDHTILATFPSQKPEPFYVSLYVNGNKLSNCIIESWVLENVMPMSVGKSLGLPLTKTFGHYYSMDAKKVPLIGQIKNSQVALATKLAKCMMLTILVANIPMSYVMLLSRSFYKDMWGEVKIDYSHAIIPMENKMIKLEPE